MSRLFATAATLFCLLLAAQGGQKHAAGPDQRPLERFQKMSPAERQKALASLPPERRRAIEQRLQRYNSLSPQEKARVDRFNKLPVERQQAVRQSVGRFNKLSPERRSAVREELSQTHAMTPEARQARAQSPELRGRFSPQEQRMIEDLREVVPQ